MATGGADLGAVVSILSPPEGGLQPQRLDPGDQVDLVSILSPPEGGLQPWSRASTTTWNVFQSSAHPKAGCNSRQIKNIIWREGFNPQPTRRRAATRVPRRLGRHTSVSILSPPEGGLQPGAQAAKARAGKFQSSAHPKAGCNAVSCTASVVGCWFQSSAHPKAGCNPPETAIGGVPVLFQSSAHPKAGCNAGERESAFRAFEVSILSPPEGGLQPPCTPA